MKYLLIADIHANIHAFRAVLRDAGKVDRIVFLGDAVDCGPRPEECVELLAETGAIAVAGNHDLGVLDAVTGAVSVSSPFAFWAGWTRNRLSEQSLAYLRRLPRSLEIDLNGVETFLIHAPGDGTYLAPGMSDAELESSLAHLPRQRIVCGHAHKLIDRQLGSRQLLSLAAVGQPKDGCNLAGYTLLDGDMFEHRRTAYDLEHYLVDLDRVGLPSAFRERWTAFIRTGYDHEWC